MYSLRHVLDKKPVELAGTIVAGLNSVVILGWWEASGEQIGVLNIFLVGVLGLFVSSKSTNNSDLSEIADSVKAAEAESFLLAVDLSQKEGQ